MLSDAAAALSSGHSAKLNRAAKRIALSTLNGSSRNVTAGGRGVLQYSVAQTHNIHM
jgi:hypothetical protein